MYATYFIGDAQCSNDGKAYIESQQDQKGQHQSAITHSGIQYFR